MEETITITMAEANVACVLCSLAHTAKLRGVKQRKNKFLMETHNYANYASVVPHSSPPPHNLQKGSEKVFVSFWYLAEMKKVELENNRKLWSRVWVRSAGINCCEPQGDLQKKKH